MNDERVIRAQQLFWEIEIQRDLRAPHRNIAVLLEQMARLHEERARELLGRSQPDGWIDMFAAITAWGDAGSQWRALDLVDEGKTAAAAFDGREGLLAELEALKTRLGSQRIVPALSDFARHAPPFQRAA